MSEGARYIYVGTAGYRPHLCAEGPPTAGGGQLRAAVGSFAQGVSSSRAFEVLKLTSHLPLRPLSNYVNTFS